MMDDKKRAVQSYCSYIHCRATYVSSVHSFDSEQQMNQQRANAEILVLQFLCSCLPQKKFIFPQFPNIIMESSSRDNFELAKLSEAFVNLENYVVLLCIMPWKQEFHQIQKYGGYYQTKIESHLHNAQSVLELIGFKEVSYGLLKLTEGINADLLQDVAFDCFVSSIECRVMHNILKRTLDVGAHLKDIINFRMETRGSEDRIVELILAQYKKTTMSVSENVADSAKVLVKEEKARPQNIGSSDQFRDKLQTHMQMAKKLGGDIEDIPFIDDNVKDSEYVPVNMDEQMIASLNLITERPQTSEQSPRVVSGLKPSQEWSFVREGLEKNYGKQYFAGIRKDILANDNAFEAILSDPKYVQIIDQNRHHNYMNTNSGENILNDQHFVDPSKDSDYATASTALYPPTMDENLMRTRGMPSITDTVLAKGCGAENSYDRSLRSKTEPIARRPPVEITPLSETFPSLKFNKSTDNRGNTSTEISNIKKYQKASTGSQHPNVNRSGPIKPNPTQYLPVVQKTSGLQNQLGSQSYSENMKRNMNVSDSENMKRNMNVSDSSGTYGSRRTGVHSAPLQNYTTLPSWSCTFCTYLNNSNSVICEMCSKTPDGTEVDAPTGITSRICDQCTFKNDRNAVSCSVCGHQLNGAQTSV